jgi:cysteine synthase
MLNNLWTDACIRTASRKAGNFAKDAKYVFSQLVAINGRKIAEMTIEEQDVVKITIMHSMSIGHELTKNRYLLIGMATGMLTTYFAMKVLNEDKKDTKTVVLEKA